MERTAPAGLGPANSAEQLVADELGIPITTVKLVIEAMAQRKNGRKVGLASAKKTKVAKRSATTGRFVSKPAANGQSTASAGEKQLTIGEYIVGLPKGEFSAEAARVLARSVKIQGLRGVPASARDEAIEVTAGNIPVYDFVLNPSGR